MELFFYDQLPAAKTGWYCHYDGNQQDAPSWSFLNILPVVRENESQWLKSFEAWHVQVSNIATRLNPWWWTVSASRLMSWHPASLKPLFFALALIQALRKKSISSIVILGAPPEVIRYFQELAPGWKISKPRKAMPFLPRAKRTLQALKKRYWVTRHYARLVLRAISNLFRRSPPHPEAQVIAYSHVLGLNNLKATGDHFFGRILGPKPLVPGLKTLWLYTIDADHPDEETSVSHHLSSLGCHFAFVNSFLKLQDIAVIAWRALACIRFRPRIERLSPPLEIDGFTSRTFVHQFFRDHANMRGFEPVLEIQLYLAFRRILAWGNTRLLVYPYEEKGLERAILRAANESSPPPITVGFTPALHHPGFLYLSDRLPYASPPPKPQWKAVTGPATLRWITAHFGVKQDKIFCVGSPRHRMPLPPPQKNHAGPLRVLLLVGRGHELIRFADWIGRMPNLLKGCELLVRKNTRSWLDQQAIGMQRIEKAGIRLKPSFGNFEDQLQWTEVSLFCSTSAGIESMLAGRATIYLDLNEYFSLDPISGKDPDHITPRADSPEKLKELLKKIRQMDTGGYQELISNQIGFATEIYPPLDLSPFAKILERPQS